MNHSCEETMKKINVVNLDKLLDNFSEIEKKISEINETNNLLVLQLEKCNRLLTLSQSREESVKEVEVKEVEYREQSEKKELEILELTRQLKIQNEEKQNEIIKLQIEFNAKLARVQNKTTKSFSEASVFPQSIYRRVGALIACSLQILNTVPACLMQPFPGALLCPAAKPWGGPGWEQVPCLQVHLTTPPPIPPASRQVISCLSTLMLKQVGVQQPKPTHTVVLVQNC
ncbi:coiled-coil domain-containing protein 152 isoform X1 [Tyto alba]|uniref:coiled-coil domain-containing protein 152 isoform X1 n=1 Tax=Tyto alba TaxID=56313 RepID=UPI001403FA55|nr:coiled-coil domain-containing protein 152 isoform X1 [Tyto alba]